MLKHKGVKYKIKKHIDSRGNMYFTVKYYAVKYIIKHRYRGGLLREIVKREGWFDVMHEYARVGSPLNKPKQFKSKKSAKKYIKK